MSLKKQSDEGDQTSGCRSSALKRVKSAGTHNYRKIQKLELKLKEMKKKEEYRKECQRMKLSPDLLKCSPRTKSQRELMKHKVPDHIEKTLVFQNTVVQYVQEKYKSPSFKAKHIYGSCLN